MAIHSGRGPELWGGAVALLLLSTCSHPAAEEHVPWHVVLITIDSLRSDHLGAYGYGKDTSPFLDEFARQKVRFEQAITQWPRTGPAIATLLSGTFPATHGVTASRSRLEPRVAVLAERLRAAGYRTVAAVNAPELTGEPGFRRGFDTFYEVSAKKGTTPPPDEGPLSEARQTTDLALKGLDEAGEGEVFLWVHYGDPRAPYDAPERTVARFRDPAEAEEGQTLPFRDPALAPSPEWSIDCINDRVAISGEQRVAEYVARYDAEIRTVDDQIRELMKELRTRGLLQDALVVVTADHGIDLGENHCYFAAGMFADDACCHVPLLFSCPGLAGPVTVAETVSLVDVTPTILHALHLRASGCEGQSLRPLVEQTGGAPGPYVFAQAGQQGQAQCMIQAPRWKLLWVPEAADRALLSGEEYELYSLGTGDVRETRVPAETRPEVVEVLRQRLQEHFPVGRRPRAEGQGAAAPAPQAEDSPRVQAKERPAAPRPPREGAPGRRGDGKH